MLRMTRSWLPIALMLLIGSTQAEVFKWIDDQGKVHFGDRPPTTVTAEKVTVRVNTYSGPPVVTQSTAPALASADVEIYSAQWCGVCTRAKRYFKAKRIPFRELDIDNSRAARRGFDRLGGKGVPIILVGDQRMDGFSIKGFERMVRR